MGTKHPTNTVLADGSIVPWLAAAGALAYTPESPPPSNYFFQYGWHLPSLFKDRRHYYFGYCCPITRRDAFDSLAIEPLIDFWKKAATRAVERVVVHLGQVTDHAFTAPIACYRYRPRGKRSDRYVLIQHGSYQAVKTSDQPHVPDGKLLIYRGVGASETFCQAALDLAAGQNPHHESIRRYWLTHRTSFSDSEVSFGIAHSRVHRCETDFLRIGTTWCDLASAADLPWTSCPVARQLRASYLQSFTLRKEIASHKFGPHYVTCLTPLDNVRITTFFAGEAEVLVLDPARLEVVATRGCDVVRVAHEDLDGRGDGPLTAAPA